MVQLRPIVSPRNEGIVSPSVSMIFIPSNTHIFKFCLIVVVQDSEPSNMKGLLITVFSRQLTSVVKRFWKATKSSWWLCVSYGLFVHFKLVFSDNRCQFIDTKTPSC